MIWKKGQTFRKMPPLSMIQGIRVEDRKRCISYACELITRSMYAGMRRENQKVPPGRFYFFMEFDVDPPGLHIYPTPDKQLVVRVRYLPRVVEI